MSKFCYSISEDKKSDKSFYNRCYHLKEINTIKLIANAYNIKNEQVVLSSSGIEALSILLETNMINEKFRQINLFYSNELYCDTLRLIKYYEKIYGIFTLIQFNLHENLEDKIRKNYKDTTNIILLESCSNPNGILFDYDVIPSIKKNTKNTLFIVDNTWLTHVCFNPFKYDIDFVFCSMSKHYSSGNCIGGFIAGPIVFMNNMKKFKINTGKHISLPYCDIIIKEMPFMEKRIIETFYKTLEIASFMNNYLKNVNYPLLENNSSYTLAKKYLRYGPNMLSFVLNKKKEYTIYWMKQFKTIKYKTSFGSSQTKFDCWPVALDETNTQIRLSIGYDCNVEETINELKLRIIDLSFTSLE